MDLCLFHLIYFLSILFSAAVQAELTSNVCPTSRRLLFLNGFNFPFGEKKSEHISSSSKSSPSKSARTDNTHGLIVFIRPQTSSELGRKVRSYSHLLKPKLFTKEERAQLKQLRLQKKKSYAKKKNTTEHPTKTRELIAVNDDSERDRCRSLLQIGHQNSLIPVKDAKKIKNKKPKKDSISSKVKNITSQAKKKLDKKVKSMPINDKKKSKNPKPSKSDTKSDRKEKKKPTDKPSEPRLVTPSSVNEQPIKRQAPPPPPPTPPTNTKTKREKSPPPPVIQTSAESLDIDGSLDMDGDDKNNSVVGRAYHFVKNMFQLSDDMIGGNHTYDDEPIVATTHEQQHRQNRKLLSFDDEINHLQFDLEESLLLTANEGLSSAVTISKRQLLSVKTNKRSTSTKEKKVNADTNKPKVGWNYRYRISRYLADEKGTRGNRGKSKQPPKKTISSTNSKVSKRKLLELNPDGDASLIDNDDIFNQDIVNTVSITQTFVPKRQLLSSKKSRKHEKETDDEEDEEEDKENIDRLNERRRKKSLEELTDPIEIVRSYDRGLFKPRVGWQFRYRVSRYIDSLRQNIREDQERLKLGLQAIKRKTPQELSGRRKRVLDKPFTPEFEERTADADENKPNVGWRYRYRISKMLEAKRLGVYVDDEAEKRKARLDQKHKPAGVGKPSGDDDECIEWEYDIDPELRKISEEGKRVGWAYRYRIRRKLDELKRKQAETGIPFDLSTLGGKREKKVSTTTATKKVTPTSATEEKSVEVNKKAVGWQYRYRISKMREAQKLEKAAASTKSTSKKHDQTPAHEKLDPQLARLTPDERAVGWQYRYRIRRKLDAIKNTTQDGEGGKRSKKSKQLSTSKRKDKEQIIKQVEESIEKILNIDDIDETPFMEYFRRSSSYIFSGLVPTARKSICLLPLPVTFSFCREGAAEDVKKSLPTSEPPKQKSTKKLDTKKEKRAKQFIHSRPTKLDTVDEKVDLPTKPLSKPPTTTVEKPQKKVSHQRVARPAPRRDVDEQVKHYNEEEHPIKKLIGVEAKKKNKKKFQIIGKEVKIKHKHATTPPTPISTTTPSVPVTTTSPPPPVAKTTPPPPPITITNPPPVIKTTPAPPLTTTRPPPTVTNAPPVKEVPKTTPTPTTTHAPPLRTISELIQEEDEASTLLSTKPTYSDETKEEINEANENLQTTSSSSSVVKDSISTSEEDSDSTSSDSESDSNDTESTSTDSDSQSDEETDLSTMNKIKQAYDSTKKSVHDLSDDDDSS